MFCGARPLGVVATGLGCFCPQIAPRGRRSCPCCRTQDSLRRLRACEWGKVPGELPGLAFDYPNPHLSQGPQSQSDLSPDPPGRVPEAPQGFPKGTGA